MSFATGRSAMSAACALVLLACGEPASPSIVETDASRPDVTVTRDVAPAPWPERETDAAAPDVFIKPLDPPDGGPIDAEPEHWTWVDVPGTRCADGSPTGFGINLARDSNELMIFLQGGGACWSGASCYGPVPTALYMRGGYGRREFELDPLRPAVLPMRRGDTANPFRRMNLVYVPYCTGDIHAGNRITSYEWLGRRYPTYHVGAQNIARVLARLKSAFSQPSRVYFAGDSAGAFATLFHFDRARSVFADSPVDLLDDSGPPIRPDPDRWALWREAWNLPVPADCPQCANDVGAIVDYLRGRYPDSRFAFLGFDHDTVLSAFLNLSPGAYASAITAFTDRLDRDWPRSRYFYRSGALHVSVGFPSAELTRWLEQMVANDPRWTSARP